MFSRVDVVNSLKCVSFILGGIRNVRYVVLDLVINSFQIQIQICEECCFCFVFQ